MGVVEASTKAPFRRGRGLRSRRWGVLVPMKRAAWLNEMSLPSHLPSNDLLC
jgi:hypothetical protein